MSSNDNGEGIRHNIRLILAGSMGVGKSHLVQTFIRGKGGEYDLTSTLGVEAYFKNISVGDHRVRLTISDTSGQERFSPLNTAYYRRAHAIMIVYDVTDRESFLDLEKRWFKEVGSYAPENAKIILVANKVDEEDRRTTSTDEGQIYARSKNALYVETSAKENVAVKTAFNEVILEVIEGSDVQEEERRSPSFVHVVAEEIQGDGCRC